MYHVGLYVCMYKELYFLFVSSGWISSLTGLNLSIPVGIMMIIIAALFTASAVISLVMFKKVSSFPCYSIKSNHVIEFCILFVEQGNLLTPIQPGKIRKAVKGKVYKQTSGLSAKASQQVGKVRIRHL